MSLKLQCSAPQGCLTDPRDIELDNIRRKLSAKVSSMTPEEQNEYFRKVDEAMAQEFNIKISPMKPCRPVKREELLA